MSVATSSAARRASYLEFKKFLNKDRINIGYKKNLTPLPRYLDSPEGQKMSLLKAD